MSRGSSFPLPSALLPMCLLWAGILKRKCFFCRSVYLLFVTCLMFRGGGRRGGDHREVAHVCCRGAVWSCSQTARALPSACTFQFHLTVTAFGYCLTTWVGVSGVAFRYITLHLQLLSSADWKMVMKGEAKRMDGQGFLVIWYGSLSNMKIW